MIALLLKASLIIAFLLVFYKIFLERESFFAKNRIYLLGSLILAFVLPFVSLPKLINNQGVLENKIEILTDNQPILDQTESIHTNGSATDLVSTASETQNPEPMEEEKGLIYWLLVLYYFGATIFSLNLIAQVATILIKVRKSDDRISDTDCTIVNTKSIKEPCSFFNYIFITPESYDHSTYEQIISHEKIHVKKFHSLDLLISEIVVIILWFNPIAWFFRKEVEKNIEYQTDAILVNGASAKKESYQMNLLKIASLNKPLAITTNYNQSLIKKRILKMDTKKSNSHANWKYAFIAPMLFLILLLINKPFSALAQTSDTPIATDITLENDAFSGEIETSIDCKELLRAIKDENLTEVKKLLKSTDPNCIDESPEPQVIYNGNHSTILIGGKRTPLVTAAKTGNLEIGKVLLGAKADVNLNAHGDESPLMAASANGHLDFVKYLIENGAEVNKAINGDGTALLVASKNGHLDIVAYLVSQKAQIDQSVPGDGTPLINAVRNGHLEIVKLLLENGADPYLEVPGDEYPMYHARASKDKSMIELLGKYETHN
ncbi:MAG: ankyrin repeat domain-containing protein [Bacteroidota bacterium]